MTGFNWHNPYPTTRIPVFARNVVSTSHPLAAQAGLRMLWKGGNAVAAGVWYKHRTQPTNIEVLI